MPVKKQFNKSQFIRSNPSLSAKELVALAAKKGVELSPNMIYAIRSDSKKKGIPSSQISFASARAKFLQRDTTPETLETLLTEYAGKIRALMVKEIVGKLGAQ